MKRFTAILLTGMMIFTLASCGKKAQDTPTEPATETQAAEKVEMPTETEAVTEVVTEAAKDTQQTEAQQEEQTAEQQDEEKNNSGENNSSYQYVERASYENGESVSLNPSWQYADHSAINSGCAVMYKATANRKNIVVGVNAGHGTSGGTSVKTLCHPDGSAKTTGGTTGAGATKAVAVSSLVRRTITEIRHARRGTHDLHVQLRDRNALTNLVIGATRRKHRKAVGEGNLPRQTQARRKAGHVRLGNAHLKVPLRELL